MRSPRTKSTKFTKAARPAKPTKRLIKALCKHQAAFEAQMAQAIKQAVLVERERCAVAVDNAKYDSCYCFECTCESSCRCYRGECENCLKGAAIVVIRNGP